MEINLFATKVTDVSALTQVERVSGFRMGYDSDDDADDIELYGHMHQHTTWGPTTLGVPLVTEL